MINYDATDQTKGAKTNQNEPRMCTNSVRKAKAAPQGTCQGNKQSFAVNSTKPSPPFPSLLFSGRCGLTVPEISRRVSRPVKSEAKSDELAISSLHAEGDIRGNALPSLPSHPHYQRSSSLSSHFQVFEGSPFSFWGARLKCMCP